MADDRGAYLDQALIGGREPGVRDVHFSLLACSHSRLRLAGWDVPPSTAVQPPSTVNTDPVT